MAALAIAGLALAQDGQAPKPDRTYRFEILYTMHARVDTGEKLERIRARMPTPKIFG